MAIDHAVQSNLRGSASLLGFTYRFAPRATLAEFDTLAQCDSTTALALFNELQALNPAEAASFEAGFWQAYPVDAANLFEFVALG